MKGVIVRRIKSNAYLNRFIVDFDMKVKSRSDDFTEEDKRFAIHLIDKLNYEILFKELRKLGG